MVGARCYVCTDSETNKVAGYYTLSAVAVEHADLPGRARRNAPNPVPAVLLGHLAIDRKAQGAGWGRLLVRDAISSTLAAADRIAVRLLLVHALHHVMTWNPGPEREPDPVASGCLPIPRGRAHPGCTNRAGGQSRGRRQRVLLR